MASDESDGPEAKEETNWTAFTTLIQSKGNMRREEILAAPLLLLNSIHKELMGIMANEIAGSMGAGMMGMFGGGTKVQAPQKDPRFGETPQFDSREEYFNFVNKQSR